MIDQSDKPRLTKPPSFLSVGPKLIFDPLDVGEIRFLNTRSSGSKIAYFKTGPISQSGATRAIYGNLKTKQSN